MRLSRPVAASAATVAVALVAGCGASAVGEGTPGHLSPAAAVQRAAESATSDDSASYTMEISGAGGAGKDEAAGMKAHGAFRTLPAPAMRMVVDASPADADLRYGFEQVIVGGAMYMREGSAPGKGTKKWVKIPLDAAGGAGELITSAAQTDPRKQLQMLLGAGDVREVGTEKVDGQAATHYAGRLTRGELLGNAKVGKALRDQLADSFAAEGAESVAFDLWVDSRYRTRRIVMTVPRADSKLTVRMSFTGYGSEVRISAPPARDVVSVEDLSPEDLSS